MGSLKILSSEYFLFMNTARIRESWRYKVFFRSGGPATKDQCLFFPLPPGSKDNHGTE